MFKSIKIKNFRGITDLKLENLSRVNLIVGKNNCGKTTILESIFLLIGASNASLPRRINEFRGYLAYDSYSWSVIFRGTDITSNVELLGIIDRPKETRKLVIRPYDSSNEFEIIAKKSDQASAIGNNTNSSTAISSNIDGLTLEYSHIPVKKQTRTPKKYITHVYFRDNQPFLDKAKNYKESLTGALYNSQNYFIDLTLRFDHVQINKQLESVIKILQEIEPSLKNLILGKDGVIYCDIGLAKYLPINVMGDGFVRLFAIILAIQEMKNGVLLIDEIENGLYFQTQQIMWKMIIESARLFNVQLFITTHSMECIRAMFSSSGSEKQIPNNVTLYRIERDNLQFHAEKYDPKSLEIAIRENWEVR
jgi:AAA15 family ATPase/GTPase